MKTGTIIKIGAIIILIIVLFFIGRRFLNVKEIFDNLFNSDRIALESEIVELRRNNDELNRELEFARSETNSLRNDNAELRTEYNKIRERLEGGIKISSELREDNQEASRLIEESLDIVRRIKENYSGD